MVKKKVHAARFEIDEKKAMIEPGHIDLTIERQCELIDLNRSTLYYKKEIVLSDKYCFVKAAIIDIYNSWPFYGARRITIELQKRFFKITRKKVRKLMVELKIQAIFPGPNTSKARHEHKKFPYLLRNVPITHNNQVWSTDITYIRMRHGFVYLTAIIDWHSRFVLGWKLSNTMEDAFCVEALEEVISKWGKCLIFNTDQGSQYTGDAFISVLKNAEIKISMDGKGRALDNVYIERLWRSVKYENVFLKCYETMKDLKSGLDEYFRFYNYQRPHLSLNKKTPWEIYSKSLEEKIDKVA